MQQIDPRCYLVHWIFVEKSSLARSILYRIIRYCGFLIKVKETRQSESDTSTGLQKMSIGHHLGDRAHIIEKSQNKLTGQQDECEEFINLDESSY